MHWYVIALVIGALIPFQIAANSRVGRDAGDPLHGTLSNFLIGLVALAFIMLARSTPMPAIRAADAGAPAGLSAIPWWAWLGGLVGVAYVYGSVRLTPHIGPVLFLALVVAGQMVCSLLLDHFGVLGFQQRSLSLPKVAGVVLIVLGVLLVRK
jgi:transporter family-2 protein